MIHSYKFDDKNIVLDVFSGSIHLVDEVAYDVINLYESKSKAEIVDEVYSNYNASLGISRDDVLECISDVETLKAEGKLFAPDKYADIAANFRKKNFYIKALCLHVAHTCNLNCSYCFASQGKYHGQRAIMSYEIGARALDFLIENSGYHKNLDVDFFGGEPLMNFEVVKQLVMYGRELEKKHNKNIRFTLTTNGVKLDDEVIDFCNDEMHNVVLSLDGRKEVNDRFRVDNMGRGSYDVIVPNFKRFVEKRGDKSYYMRGTFTHYNTDFLNDIKHMADLGFSELSMEPVVTDPSEPAALTEEDLPILFDQYEELAREMIKRNKQGNGFTFYHYMINLTCGPCIYKRVAGCGSGTEYMAVTPWGELFPCHQFVGDSKYSMGDIYKGVTNTAMRDKFASLNAYSRPECQNCWAKLYCSGGCAANSYHATGEVDGIYEYGCKLFKKRIECALAVKLSESTSSSSEAQE
ncbi:MAG TPA: thioether cross-link-forming SCIFF peptide maturase [Saccharofermentans sp.]|nr:thioether cross-link-forming SCIFF peptide maturase [Clostridia bacterium]NLX68486.1 thioether cross-link-forming SCIFF peptide maturase [Clostridiaceae bacterium]HOO48732.1 thioether cross-link-forming SCIFF peptide maturase [Saccharofermentans sp.]HPE28281.1 thioether cross-link-forming SCIFF peptide maturase [Saccharofermentans sp.]HPG64259.1 thioether cross-link-forming SCIFF peptide maturase [Saccharofermentans sp.]